MRCWPSTRSSGSRSPTPPAPPGTDPDRASFTIALETARDQVIQAANVIAGTVIDLVGTIGRRVLDNLMPDRRLRLSPRAVKRPLSRYAYKSLKIDRRSYKATQHRHLDPAQPTRLALGPVAASGRSSRSGPVTGPYPYRLSA